MLMKNDMKKKILIVIVFIFSIISLGNILSIADELHQYKESVDRNLELINNDLLIRTIDGQDDVIILNSIVNELRTLFRIENVNPEKVSDRLSFVQSVLEFYSDKLLELSLQDYDASVQTEARTIKQNSNILVKWYVDKESMDVLELLERFELNDYLIHHEYGWQVKGKF